MVTRSFIASGTCLCAALLLLAGCPLLERSRNVDRFAPTERTGIDIEVQFPANGSFATTCAGANGYLMRIDTNGEGVWDYTLLFDSTRTTLYGCGASGTACPPETVLAREIPAISRLLIEGISVLPADYAAASGSIDVVCRGLADEEVVPGTIVLTEDTTTPTPQPTPGYVTTRVFTVPVKMLEVGASNQLPFGTGIAPTQRRFGAAASLSVPEHSIGLGAAGPRGRVAIAGGIEEAGTLPNQIWEFDTQNLAFSVSATTLTAGAKGLVGLSATTYSGPGGEPAILFAGGSSDIDLQSPSVLSWQEAASFRHTMVVPRSFHGAAYLQRPNPVILLIGGMNFDDASQALGAGELSDYAYFVPPASVLAAPCQTAPSPNGTFCDPTNLLLAVARGFSAAIPFFEGGAPKVWVAGGAQGGLSRNEAEAFTGSAAGGFDPSNTLGAQISGASGVVLTSSGQPALNGLPIVFGGLEDPDFPNGRNLAFYRPDAGPATQLLNLMKFRRGGLSAVALRDRTVLLVGGRDVGVAFFDGVTPLEVFVPTTAVELGEFRFAATPGSLCVTTGLSPANCPSLVTPRWGQTATRLDETWTWLDGSVLVAGGGQPSTPGAELFVPAYQCAGDAPVSPGTGVPALPLSNPTLPELCDLGRLALPITDPTNP